MNLFDTLTTEPRKRRPPHLAAIATVTAAAIGLMIIIPSSPAPHRIALSERGDGLSRELVPRGSSGTGKSHVGIRVFALAPSKGALREGPQLSIDDVITFTYTYTKDVPGH